MLSVPTPVARLVATPILQLKIVGGMTVDDGRAMTPSNPPGCKPEYTVRHVLQDLVGPTRLAIAVKTHAIDPALGDITGIHSQIPALGAFIPIEPPSWRPGSILEELFIDTFNADAIYDIFRIENGKIAEQWDTLQILVR
jgi:hypothetical protein